MVCNKCNNVAVKNIVLHKEFYYCRTCKDEVSLISEIEPIARNIRIGSMIELTANICTSSDKGRVFAVKKVDSAGLVVIDYYFTDRPSDIYPMSVLPYNFKVIKE